MATTINPNVTAIGTDLTYVVDSENSEDVLADLTVNRNGLTFPIRATFNGNPIIFLNGIEMDYFIAGYRFRGFTFQ